MSLKIDKKHYCSIFSKNVRPVQAPPPSQEADPFVTNFQARVFFRILLKNKHPVQAGSKFSVLRTYRRPNKPPKSSVGAQKPSKMSPQIHF